MCFCWVKEIVSKTNVLKWDQTNNHSITKKHYIPLLNKVTKQEKVYSLTGFWMHNLRCTRLKLWPAELRKLALMVCPIIDVNLCVRTFLILPLWIRPTKGESSWHNFPCYPPPPQIRPAKGVCHPPPPIVCCSPLYTCRMQQHTLYLPKLKLKLKMQSCGNRLTCGHSNGGSL